MRIDQAMTIYTAGELKPQMLAAVRASDTPIFDLSQVGEMDTAGLQLLMLVKREAASLGRPLGLGAVSAAVQEVLDLVSIGLDAGKSSARAEPQTATGDPA